MEFKQMGVLTKEQFLFEIDTIYQDLANSDAPDEEREEKLLATVAGFSLLQGMEMTFDPSGDRSDVMYEGFQAGSTRWEYARQYLYGTYSVEIHPVYYYLMIRGIYNQWSSLPFDVAMQNAFKKLMTVRQKEMEDLMCNHEAVNPDDVDTSILDDPETMKKFFENFKDLKEFHRDRNLYIDDEQRAKHDELMKIYHAMCKTNKEDN